MSAGVGRNGRPARQRGARHLQRAKEAIRGAKGRGLGELNERLREEFEEFRLDQMDDGVIGVQPMLRKREFDVGAAYAAWVEAGKPEPTPEQIGNHRRVQVAEDPIWVTGKEMIRPPAKPLTIPNGNLSYPQEYHPIRSGLVLPRLEVPAVA